MEKQEKKLATMVLFEQEKWPIFLKHPTQWQYIRIEGARRMILSARVELTDKGEGFIHQRQRKVYADDADFGIALDQLVGYQLVTERDYFIALRDYFRKEMEARSRFEPYYNKVIDQYWNQPPRA